MRRHKLRLVWLCGLVAMALVILLGATDRTPLQRLTPLVFDLYQRIEPRPEAFAPIAVVDIDEASIAELGQWPWPRTVIAELVDRLGDLGAATIAFDVVFSEPDRTSLAEAVAELSRIGADVSLPPGLELQDNDAVLAHSIARNPVTVGFVVSNETGGELAPPKAGFSFGGADPRDYLPSFEGGVTNLAPITEAAAGMGFFSFPPSTDGIVRVIPVLALARGQLYPSLAVEALRVAQGAGSYIVRSTGASGEIDTGTSAMTALRAGMLDVPTGPQGEFWVYFSGLASMPVIPASALIRADDAGLAELAEAVDGRIVLIGTSAVGLRDIVATPVAASMPGVMVHAEVIDQIVGQTFLTRPDWAPGAEIALAVAAGLVLVGIAGLAGAVATTAAALVLGGAVVGYSWHAFSADQQLLDPILPVATLAAVFIVTMPLLLLLTDREKQFVRGAFGRYLAPSLVERLADNPDALKLGGEIRDLTILFSDIRGFTALSEKLEPTELTTLLNGILTPMTDVLLRSQATIDKYMGDAIMAFWNAPLDIADHPRRACLAALEMLKVLEEVNRESGQELSIGIGLHRGTACVGNLGSTQRFSYSAIGDSVNLTSRVEGQTKGYGVPIIVTETVRSAAPELAYLELDLIRVVGRREPVAIFALVGDDEMAASEVFAGLAGLHAEMIAAYRSGRPDAAEPVLTRLRELDGWRLEELYQMYDKRLAAMRAEPVPENWDGVFVAEQK